MFFEELLNVLYVVGAVGTGVWLFMEASADPEYWTDDYIQDAMGMTVLIGLSILWFCTVPLHFLNKARGG